jgi:hypothetical protein
MCRHNPKLKEAWGCEKEAQERDSIPCPICDGKRLKLETCPYCDTGEIFLYRCPNATIERWMIEVVGHWFRYSEYAILPASGGFLDQTLSFCQLMELLDAVEGWYQDREAKKRKKEMDQEKKKNQRVR